MDTASIDSMRDASTISVKWNHGGVFRRFALSLTDGDIYTALMTKVHAAVPGFNQQLAWKDEDGDDIIFATTLELEEPIAALKLGQPLRLHTVNYETPSQSTTPMSAQPPMQQEPPKVETEKPPQYVPYAGSEDPKVRKLHRNVVCDLCDGAVCGRRFKCLQCPDYDLCEACKSTGAHAEHTLIRIADPDDSAWQQFTRRRGHHLHQHLYAGSEDPKVRKLHRNVVCYVCDGAVCGRRFKCLQCPDYDLCEACESTGAHAEHTLIRIADPDDSAWQYVPYAGSEDPKVRKLHRNVVCDVCGGAVCGRRFKCLQCPDYDLCEACESTGAHAEHTLIRIADPDDIAWQVYGSIIGASVPIVI